MTITFDYAMKFGPIGALMDAVMVRPQFRKALPDALLGLKHYAETGEKVDEKVIKRVKRMNDSQFVPAAT